MKLCNKCNLVKPDEEFKKKDKAKKYLSYICKLCEGELAREKILDSPELYLWHRAKIRAKSKSLEFSITPEDIIIPIHCPVLGIKLKFSDGAGMDGRWSSPSLDRIYNDKGYISGNILVISFRANFLKSNAALEELEKLYKFFSKYSNGQDV